MAKSTSLNSLHPSKSPVYGPYHAPQLHHEADVQTILGSSDSRLTQLFDRYKIRVPILLTSTGSWVDQHTSARELLATVLRNILIEPVRLQQLVNAYGQTAGIPNPSNRKIISFGPPSAHGGELSALASKSGAVITTCGGASQVPSAVPFNKFETNSRRPKLAIVGLAGRFPDAADHEKFWDLLEAGLDVHKKVCFYAEWKISSIYANMVLGP